jgi:hypothetical protein
MRANVTFITEFYSPEEPRHGQYLFVNCGKSRLREPPGRKEWDASASVVANLTGGSRVLVGDVTRRIGDKVSLTGPAEASRGEVWQSEFGMVSYAALVSIGIRYKI